MFVDNISILSTRVEEVIQFSVDVVDSNPNLIRLMSNYSVNPAQLSMLTNTSISFNGSEEIIENISTGANSTLTF